MGRKLTTGSTTSTDIYAYSDDSDSPAWIETGTNWTRNVIGLDGLEASRNQAGTTTWLLRNIRGDVVGEIGATALTATDDIDEFGVPDASLPANRRYAFHGTKRREALTSTGTVAMGVRLYVPRIGRFLQVDPVLGGTASPYEYPSDPVNKLGNCSGGLSGCGRAVGS